MFATSFAIRFDKSARLKKNHFPIVLQITFNRKVRRKRLGLNATIEQWDFASHEFRKGVHGRREKNQLLEEAEEKAKKIYKENFTNHEFNYKKFISLYNNEGESKNITVIEYCKKVSQDFLDRQQANSSNDYKYLANAIRKISPNDLGWDEFNEDWLYAFEEYFTSRGTKSFSHMVRLRALYNKAVMAKLADYKRNPFKNPYTNPYGYDFSKLKKARFSKANKDRIKDLNRGQLVSLKAYIPARQKEEEYLDLWWYSYYMFGVNLTDIAMMKWSEVKNNRWFYQRSKTGSGLKKGKPILPEALDLMNKYKSDKSNYVFPILRDGYDKDALTIANRIKDYSGHIRKASVKISKKLELDGYFTFYSARYSSATLALNEGADRNTVSHLLDHENFSTIDNYAGRADDQKIIKTMELLRI